MVKLCFDQGQITVVLLLVSFAAGIACSLVIWLGKGV